METDLQNNSTSTYQQANFASSSPPPLPPFCLHLLQSVKLRWTQVAEAAAGVDAVDATAASTACDRYHSSIPPPLLPLTPTSAARHSSHHRHRGGHGGGGRGGRERRRRPGSHGRMRALSAITRKEVGRRLRRSRAAEAGGFGLDWQMACRDLGSTQKQNQANESVNFLK